MRGPRATPAALPLFLLSMAAALACGGGEREAPSFPLAPAARQDVAVTAAADGVVEPVRAVEVKSKASGEIIELDVDTGDEVTAGQVLLRLLPRDAQNAYDQTAAELEAARARLANAEIQLARSRRLHDDGLIPAAELELDELQVTAQRAEVLRLEKSLDTAAERLRETTVRSPIDGTVLEKSVEEGQVVSSAVSQVSGGTLLLTLADLSQVQVRSLVDEVDIGQIAAGMPVEIRVEAYRDRLFRGRVFKIEPQAVVEQNVTMFPVLTRIGNGEGLLKPGMNAEVEVLIDRREGVLALPNEALKTPAEARQLTELLGLGAAEGGGEPALGGETPGGPGGEGMVVFVPEEGGGYAPRRVRPGLRNWEVTEILGGLEEGERVALLPSAAQLRQSQEFRERIQRVRGVPGMSGGGRSGGGSGRGSRGGGGGR